MIFFTSDLHFGHHNIIKYCDRPFANVDDMDTALIRNWNNKVSKHDTVWMLGDISFRTPERTKEILLELNGLLNLVLGNHDNRIKKEKSVLDCFTEVHSGFIERKFLNMATGAVVPFILCHYPFLDWDQKHNGSIHLHGHSHGKFPIEEKFFRYDVGVDTNNFEPISLDDIFTKFTPR